MIDLANEIWQTMRNNKLRTALTGVAVAWGIFMLIVLLGMSRGVVNAFDANMGKRGSNAINIYPGVTTEAWHGYKMGRYIQLKDGDKDVLESRGDNKIGRVTAKVYGQSMTLSTDRDYAMTYYEGVFPSELSRSGTTMVAGRFINDADIDQKRKVIVLSLKMAESLFANPEKSIGETVRFGNLSFLVVGVFDSRWSRQVYIPYSTARMLAGNTDNVNQLVVELDNVRTLEDGIAAERTIRNTLASIHDYNPQDESAVYFWNQFNQHLQMNTGMSILNITVWVIGIFTLLSGIIGVSNIMFVSVKERTHEIGIRRAIGAKPHSILTQIILESVSITTLFGYFGIILGTALTAVIGHFIGEQDGFLNPGVDLSIAFEVTVVLILAGAMAGMFPALKALKVKPVEALRDE
ncbi:MAG: ABC transporter permease [Muribaculaceae bacterium]|nr:ABC transporter permease [Muribaculaceae bacterium]MDE7110777.1 ABC transporter permease [Muribaculaceae bacterium]